MDRNERLAWITERTKAAGFSRLLGIEVLGATEEDVSCGLTIGPQHFATTGLVHGGVVAALVDQTLAAAVYLVIEPGKWVASVECKLNYVDWIREGQVVAKSRIASMGGRMAVVRVDVHNDGRLVALAQGTLYVRDPVGVDKS